LLPGAGLHFYASSVAIRPCSSALRGAP
jgi:hypothetical protein